MHVAHLEFVDPHPRHHHPAGLAQAQRVQQGRLEHAHDRGVGAHAEREGQHRRASKPGLAPDQAESKAEVLEREVDRASVQPKLVACQHVNARPQGAMNGQPGLPLIRELAALDSTLSTQSLTLVRSTSARV